jgi:protein-L-isoaspartate(D-aspartate) O-methyltransferase
MARTASERGRHSLVSELRAKGVVSSPLVQAAFLAVAREHFLPEVLAESGLDAVYRDDAIVTKRDARGLPLSSSSQPAIMATMLELLAVQPGDRVLEIGAGTGYNAALLAHIAGPSGRVISIDIDSDLARRARRLLRDAGVRATIVVGDGRHGHSPKAPYDRIIATAGAAEIPKAWLDQLADGGRVELPLRLDSEPGSIQLIPVLERHGDRLRSVGLTWGGFMPLHGGDGGWRPPSSTLSAVHSTHDDHLSLASLSGGGVGQLSRSSARRLLVSILNRSGETRRRGLTDLAGSRPPLLLLHLLLNIAPKRRLSFNEPGRWGIGIVDQPSQSAAIISLRSPWSAGSSAPERRARWRLDAYGADTAAIELDRLLTQWQRLEEAGQTKLRITARGGSSALRLTFAWAESYG